MLGVVAQIDAFDPILAQPVALRAASHDDPAVCLVDGGDPWWPALIKLPTLRYDLFDGAFGGDITAPSSSLTLASEPWPNLGRYALADARIRLWTGDVGAAWATWTLRFDGRVSEQPELADGAATINFAVDDRWLDAALLTTYAGTTGAEGTEALKGQPKPLALGAPRYVAGTLIDNIDTVFQLSAYGPLRGFEAALERLARFGESVGDFASYAALVAATVPAGRWATAKAVGMVRLGAPPTGQVSFLIGGDQGGPNGWARLPGAIIRRLALLSGGAGRINDASLDALDAARPYNQSIYVDQQTTARQLIQQIAASVNAVAGMSWTGQLFVVPVGIGAPGLTLAADGSALPPVGSVKQIGIASPFQKLAIGAARAWTVHALSDIAFTATLVDVGTYAEGTTYREGNIVSLADGSRWLFINTTAAAGHAPPVGTDGDDYWANLSAPIATSTAWPDVTDPDGTKPADNADVTGDNTSKDTNAVAGRPAPTLIQQHDKALVDIDNLFKTYGSTVSAAQSADAAASYSQAANDACAQSQAARDASSAAATQAEAVARNAAQSATDANGYATTASGQATIATQKADAAGQSASTATANADIASTKAGEAIVSASRAATSETGAAGSSNSAAYSAGVSATTAESAGRALAATFPRSVSAEAFTVYPVAFSANGVASAAIVGGRFVADTAAATTYPYGVWFRELIPYVVGKSYRLNANVEWVSGYPDQPSAWFYANFFRADGSFLTEFIIGPEQGPLPPNAPVDISYVVSLGADVPGAAFVRFGLVLNRKPGNAGAVTAGRTDILAFYPEDVTAELAARASASAASTSASVASASETAAGQFASAAQSNATTASTKAGEASTSAGQAATSASTAQGSQNAAASSASVAASASSEAKSSAAGMLPSTFMQGDKFWSQNWDGLDNRPSNFPPGYSTDPSTGVLSVTSDYTDIAHLGSIPLVRGRRRRMTARWLVVYAQGRPSVSANLFFIGLNAAGGAPITPPLTVSIPGSGPGWGVVNGFVTSIFEIDDAVLMDGGAVKVRGLFRYNQRGGETWQLASLTIEDITSEAASAGFASAASTSASSASASAGAAGNSAVAAQGSAQTAATANGASQQAASSAQSSAAAASASEVSAAQSVTLSAQFSSALANKGANFSDWSAGWPGYWAPWGDPANEKISPGLVGRYGFRQYANYDANETGLYTDRNNDGGLAGIGAGTYVVRADVTLIDGSLVGSGVLFRGLDANGNLIYDEPLNFVASESNVSPGIATGAGAPGQRYTFTRLCTMPAGVTQVMIYLMTAWRGFAAHPEQKRLQWNECGIRAATGEEVRANKGNANASTALAQVSQLSSSVATDISAISGRVTTTVAQVNGLEGRTSLTEQSVADINGKIAARLVLKAISPDGTAEIDIFSGGGTSGIRFGGNTTFTGKLEIGTGSGPRVEIASNRIIFDNGSVMKASGIGFGSNSQFIEWVGPSKPNLAQCTEAEAIQYIKTDGSAYFGGALSAGTLKNAAQTTVSSATASVTTGQFGSNGRQRVVTVSFFFAFSRASASSCPTNPVTPTVTLELRSGTDAGGPVLATQTFTGSYSCERAAAGDPGYVGEQLSGAFTFTDNSGGNTASYFVRITNRSTNTTPQQQSLGVISVEQ